METLAARCCTSSNEQRDLDRLLRKLSSDDRQVRDAHQALDDAGVATVADLRTVLLIPKKERAFAPLLIRSCAQPHHLSFLLSLHALAYLQHEFARQ